MGLANNHRLYVKAILDLDASQENTDAELAAMTGFKLKAIELTLLNEITSALDSIGAALERIAARMP